MQDKISVIVPVYNTEKYLEECLESIVNQSFANLEIIIVNDASPDGSHKIIQKFAQHDARIKVIDHKQNLGQSAARNSALDMACGDYIFFIDSDDTIEQSTLEIMLATAIKNNADIVGCPLRRTDEQNQNTIQIDYGSTKPYLIFLGAEEIYRAYFFRGSISVTVAAKLYKKQLWSNIRMPVGRIQEDNTVFYDITLNCKKFIQINKPHYSHRLHTESSTGKQIDEKFILDFLVFLNKLKYFFTSSDWSPDIIAGARQTIRNSLKHQCILPNNIAIFNPDALKILLQNAQQYDLETEVIEEIANCFDIVVTKMQRQQQADWWYQFGQRSNKQRVLAIAKIISQKLGFYELLQLLAAKLKR